MMFAPASPCRGKGVALGLEGGGCAIGNVGPRRGRRSGHRPVVCRVAWEEIHVRKRGGNQRFLFTVFIFTKKKKKSAPLWRKDESHLWDSPKLDSQCCQWTEWTICQPFSSYKTYFNLLFPNIIANQFPSMIATACKGVSHQLVVFVYFNWGSLKFTRIIHSPNHKSEVPTVEKLGLVAGNKVKLVRLN